MNRRVLVPLIVLGLAAVATALVGCNTVRGMADDVKAVADHTDKALTGDVR